MSFDALVTCKVVKPPKWREAKSGKDYCVAQVAVSMGDEGISPQ